MYGSRRYRKFSPSRVVAEMEMVANRYGVREVYFDDDDFTIDRNHVLEICRLIKEKGLHKKKLKWSCMGDAINIDEALVKEMASAGCIGIKFGVESASPEVLEKIGKPVRLEKILKSARMCSRLGIKTHATFTIGLIGDTPRTIAETMKFAMRLDADSIQVSVATPYPGTEFYRWAKERKYIDEKNLRWSDFDGTSASPLMNIPGLDGELLEKLRAGFFRRWLIRKIFTPRWVVNQLRILLRSIRGQGAVFFFTKLFWGVFNSIGLKPKS